MGKFELQQQQQQQHLNQGQIGVTPSSTLLCQRCLVGLTGLANEFNFKCLIVLILSLSVFLSAIFWILPFHSIKSGFDAKDAIKLSATVQACFILEKPVSLLVPHIQRLEYDLSGEVGVPNTKVAILSMHKHGASNYTYVVFGVLSDPMNAPINPVPLSVLRSSLVELFLQQSNLTLTTAIFGQPSCFELLKFHGGITVIPPQSASIWQIPQILFNFSLYNSVSEIQENFAEFKDQLKLGLHLRSYENVYVQITNKDGSTIDPPVTVQASVMSDLGILLPQRLKQLAQTISNSPPAKNLGLNNTVFGKVKGISLSSYLKGTLHPPPPTPAPAPSPEQNEYAEPSASPYPAPLSYSPAPSPEFQDYPPPCIECYASSPPDDSHPHAPSPQIGPDYAFPPVVNSPAPSMAIAHPPSPRPSYESTISPSPSPAPNVDPIVPSVSPSPSPSPTPSPSPSPSPYSSPRAPSLPPSLPPLPAVSYGSSPGQDKGSRKRLVSPSLAPSPFEPSQASFAISPSYKEIWILVFSNLLSFHLLCWLYW